MLQVVLVLVMLEIAVSVIVERQAQPEWGPIALRVGLGTAAVMILFVRYDEGNPDR